MQAVLVLVLVFLVFAALAYTVFGTAPVWLPALLVQLVTVLLSRLIINTTVKDRPFAAGLLILEERGHRIQLMPAAKQIDKMADQPATHGLMAGASTTALLALVIAPYLFPYVEGDAPDFIKGNLPAFQILYFIISGVVSGGVLFIGLALSEIGKAGFTRRLDCSLQRIQANIGEGLASLERITAETQSLSYHLGMAHRPSWNPAVLYTLRQIGDGVVSEPDAASQAIREATAEAERLRTILQSRRSQSIEFLSLHLERSARIARGGTLDEWQQHRHEFLRRRAEYTPPSAAM